MTITITSATEALANVQTDLLDRLPWLATFTKDGIGGRDRAGLRRWVADFSGGLCCLCGEPADVEGNPRDRSFAHLGHLISAEYIAMALDMRLDAQGKKGGYVAGNLCLQHKGCNTDAGTNVIRPEDLARPDLVPLSLPKPSSLRGYGKP